MPIIFCKTDIVNIYSAMSTWAFLRLPTFYYSFKKLLDYRSFFNLSGKMFQILGPKSFQSHDTPNLERVWQIRNYFSDYTGAHSFIQIAQL